MKLSKLLEAIELREMPIQNFQSIGNPLDKGGSFDKTDRAILSSEKGIEKIKRIFSNSQFEWNLYFINSGKLRGKGEAGIYSFNEFKNYMENNNVDVSELKEDDPNAINVCFVSNSAANKNQLSAWILAHRIGHAMRLRNSYWDQLIKDMQREFSYTIQWVYNKDKYRWDWYDSNPYTKSPQLRLLCDLGKFKSARDKKIRNVYEANYEFFAQYVITNSVTMNPMPERFEYSKSESDIEDRQEASDHLASMYEADFHNICAFAKGKWLIM